MFLHWKYGDKCCFALFYFLVKKIPHTSAEWFGRHPKNELAKPHINYESRTIMWYKIPNFDEKNRPILRKPIFESFYSIKLTILAFKKQFSPIFCHLTQCLGLEFTITQLLAYVGTGKTCKKPFLSSRYQWLGQK